MHQKYVLGVRCWVNVPSAWDPNTCQWQTSLVDAYFCLGMKDGRVPSLQPLTPPALHPNLAPEQDPN